MGVAEKYFFLPKPVCKPCLVSHSLPGPHVSARGEVTASGNIFPVGLEIFFSSFDSKYFFPVLTRKYFSTGTSSYLCPDWTASVILAKTFLYKLIREGNFSTFSVKKCTFSTFLLQIFSLLKNISKALCCAFRDQKEKSI